MPRIDGFVPLEYARPGFNDSLTCTLATFSQSRKCHTALAQQQTQAAADPRLGRGAVALVAAAAAPVVCDASRDPAATPVGGSLASPVSFTIGS